VRKIERVSITDEAVKRIKSFIMDENLESGSKLPTEAEFCEMLGVGRSTIREAFRVIQALGLIDVQHGKGTFVKRKTEEESLDKIRLWFMEKESKVNKVMEVRMAIKPLAIRLAIQHGLKEQIEQIVEIHEDFSVAVSNNDIIVMATLDEASHSAIVEASDNPLLTKIEKLLSNSLIEYRMRSFAMKKNTMHALKSNQYILDALLSKNEKAAEKAVQEHLKISLEDITELLEEGAKKSA
jgi:GntR family transcriptional repressor for pyruvate dehydrogenase complex